MIEVEQSPFIHLLFPELLRCDLDIDQPDPDDYPKILKAVLEYGREWKHSVVDEMVKRGFVQVKPNGPNWALDRLLDLDFRILRRLRNELILINNQP